MKTISYFTVLIAGVLGISSVYAHADITIASQGKSTFTIVLPQKSPASIQEAAEELQFDVAEATGAKIPVQKDDEKISGAFISLGATMQAQAAGITTKGIADEGFRILTKGSNVYILGPDTSALIGSSRDTLPYDTYTLQPDLPGPQLTKDSGFSNGTANGVYSFLEDYLDVRWLFPGNLGRDVPVKNTFILPDIDHTEAPSFIWRDFPYLQNTPAAKAWRDHQKLGFSFRLNFNHNWIETVTPDMYKDHPDWFAMIGNNRPAPPTSGPHRRHYKLETTNPELIKFFAEKAIAALKADPYSNTFSLSPSDGRGYSESPQSKALYDPPPAGSDFPSVTPLIFKWYHDVAAIVAHEYPQGKLAGYIYQDFSYPPAKGDIKLPENFTPVITGKDSGYAFYRNGNRQLGASLMDSWAKVAPSIWFYYSFGTWLRSSSGMLQPLAPGNLNYTFSLLRKNHIKGARLYGTEAWSQAAMINYVQAKMLWNPQLDAAILQREWLNRAYGPKAGALMEQFYQELDNGFADYYQKNASADHNTREALFKQVYAAHYPEMEKLFLQAQLQPMSAIQKQRLELIEENMIVLQWRLRNADYLAKDFTSPLQRNNAQVVDLLLAKHNDFDYFPSIVETGPSITPIKVQLASPLATTTKTLPMPNANYILLYSPRGGEVHLTPRNVHPGSSFLSYAIRETTGNAIQSGVLYDGEDISFKAKAETAYYLYTATTGIDVLPKATWEMSIPEATPATATFQTGVLYLQGTPASLYVYVPQGLPLNCQSDASSVVIHPKTQADERNKAALKLYPQAKPVQSLNTDWRFNPDPQNTGLSQGFTHSDFDDTSWKNITVTDWWQNQGFKDYQGTAWYRKTFVAPRVPGDQLLILFLGSVDGNAKVYFNGKKMGEHLLSQDGKGWDQPFGIDVTSALKPGQNTVTVKVTKANNMGGIYKGVSLLMMEDPGTF